MTHWPLVAAKVAVMVLGFVIAYQAYRGYRRNDSDAMLYLGIGFFFVSVGAMVEGLLFEFTDVDLVVAGAIQTAIVAVGMLFVLYSLYGATGAGSVRRRTVGVERGDDEDGP